ncbi:MAG: PD40 domain-containing protein [Verrucomicrobia bacterium]|nr:PD40 domain-containing protein [Verrucomicrobiota bacterium]
MSSNIVPSFGIGLVDFDVLETNVVEIPASPGTGNAGSSFSTNVGPRMTIVLTNAGPVSATTWTRMPWLSLSSDGSRISFLADAINLIADVTNRVTQLYSLRVDDGHSGLITSNSTGQAGADLSSVAPTASPDGLLIAWDSPEDNIVSDDLNRAWDVFVRNVDTGETQLVSQRDSGLPAASGLALSRLDLTPGAISANGQRLAILSLDNTLVPDDTNRWRDLIVRDLAAGTNFDVSRSSDRFGNVPQTSFPGTNAAAAPVLSADGRQIAFAAESATLGGFGTNSMIYRRDLSYPSNQVVASGGPFSRPVISPDGRFVAFHSFRSFDSYYTDANNQDDVYLFGPRIVSVFGSIIDCPLDPSVFPPRFASSSSLGSTAANGSSVNPAFSPDSNWLLFESLATDLLANRIPAPSRYQLYARSFVVTNRLALGCLGRVEILDYSPTRLISYAVSRSADPLIAGAEVPLPGGGANPRFSADAQYVAFESGTNLIYRHDLRGEWKATVGKAEGVAFTNYARPENLLVCSNCANASLNLDGRYIAYESRPALGGGTNILLKDLSSGSVELVSVSLSGTNANGSSFSPSLSQDSRFVVFASRASDLVPGDNNRATDIFVRDRWTAVTHCLSRNLAGTGTGNRVSSNPILSADGRTVAFQSFASDLVAGDYNDTRDVFVVTLGGPDNDGDGMEDDWEVAYFNTLTRDGSGDFDNDGAIDRDEFRAGTSPANESSILRVLRLTTGVAEGNAAARTTVILWQSIRGRTYRVETKEDIRMPWAPVGADVVATGTTASVTHEQDVNGVNNRRNSFYRVVLVQ